MDPERQLATLRYWMDVEGLTAPDAGREERERYQSCVHVVDGRLPWLERRADAGPRVHYVRFGLDLARATDLGGDRADRRHLRGLLAPFGLPARGAPVKNLFDVYFVMIALLSQKVELAGNPGRFNLRRCERVGRDHPSATTA